MVVAGLLPCRSRLGRVGSHRDQCDVRRVTESKPNLAFWRFTRTASAGNSRDRTAVLRRASQGGGYQSLRLADTG